MAKKRKQAEVRQSASGKSAREADARLVDSGTEPPVSNWSPRIKLIVSVLACLHLFSVFSAPWSMPAPASQLARVVNDLASPYTNLLYMQHAYRFFAPEPGPSHLIHYEVSDEQGAELAKGRFPDRNKHRPRLMYHRYFMIAEHFWGIGSAQPLGREREMAELMRAAEFLRENGFADQSRLIDASVMENDRKILTDEEIEQVVEDLRANGRPHEAFVARRDLRERNIGLEMSQQHYDAWLAGIAKYLKQLHGGDRVRIWIQEHNISPFHRIRDGGKLDDADTYGPRILVYSEDEVIE